MEARIFMPGPRIPRRCLGESYMQVFPRSVAPPCADTVRAGLSALGARVLEVWQEARVLSGPAIGEVVSGTTSSAKKRSEG